MVPGVSLDSSVPPGRGLEAAGAQALPWFVFGASSAPFPPSHAIFPFPPSPHCSPRTVPTQVALPCHPLASPPSGSEGMVEVGRGWGGGGGSRLPSVPIPAPSWSLNGKFVV